jgi:hypothetical protein
MGAVQAIVGKKERKKTRKQESKNACVAPPALRTWNERRGVRRRMFQNA